MTTDAHPLWWAWFCALCATRNVCKWRRSESNGGRCTGCGRPRGY